MNTNRWILLTLVFAGGVFLGGIPALGQQAEGPASRMALELSPVVDPGSDSQRGLLNRSTTSYRIDTGDRVSITVYGEPDLSVTDAGVEGDGTISFPLLGELTIRGLTSLELKELVTRKLADGYLKKPHVSVSIDKYRLYYIKGEVKRPGGYHYVEGLTVEKAVALAGGFTVRASEDRITLVGEDDSDRSRRTVPPDTPIAPGDVITVGESFF